VIQRYAPGLSYLAFGRGLARCVGGYRADPNEVIQEAPWSFKKETSGEAFVPGGGLWREAAS
jgi:hypothetical protein